MPPLLFLIMVEDWMLDKRSMWVDDYNYVFYKLSFVLDSGQFKSARKDRNWELYDKLTKTNKSKCRLEELIAYMKKEKIPIPEIR